MRDIKFRAWDKKEKKMYEVKEIAFGDCLQVDVSEDMNDDFRHVISSCSETPTIELMQYTGLKDKNGKEIYEGDIVKILDDGIWCFDRYTIGEVDFDWGEFIFKKEPTDSEDDGYCSITNFHYVGDGTDRKHDINKHPLFEVIGNIYENPELLKETK